MRRFGLSRSMHKRKCCSSFTAIFSYANSAFCIESENDDDFDSNGDEEEEVELESVIRQTTTRIKKIDLSPEAVKKRKEVYSKWLESVK